MNYQNRNQNGRGRGRGRGRGSSYKDNMPKLEKCPFIVGSNEYHEWKRERYSKRKLIK